MKLTNQERLDLYDSIKSELLKGKETEDQLCEKYATKHSLDKEFVKDVYLTMEEEMAQLQERFEKMLAEGIKKSKEKSKLNFQLPQAQRPESLRIGKKK